jgi:hypothetical protein
MGDGAYVQIISKVAAGATALGRALGLTPLSKTNFCSFIHSSFKRHLMESIVLVTGDNSGIQLAELVTVSTKPRAKSVFQRLL